MRLKGETAAAIESFREVLRLDPASAEAHGNLGMLLLERGEAAEALTHFLEAVRLRPGFAPALVNLGNALQVLGRLEAAEACFREAIAKSPGLAASHAGLAGVLEQLGDLEGSLASLREALRHDPRYAGVLARLATRLRGDLSASDLETIEGLLADPALPSESRGSLEFGLAHVFDARGDFERAAGFAARANARQRESLEARGRGYDPEAHRRFVDQLIAAFSPAFFERVRGFGLETKRPVFVVGLPRSGTTLIEQVLASHPQVFGAGELRLVKELFQALPEVTGCPGPLMSCLEHLDREAVATLGHRYLKGLDAWNDSADRVVDKMPENTLYLGWIATLFPKATLIHCRRDARDVALSCWLTNFSLLRWACDPGHIASRILESRRVMDHWRRVLPIPVLDVEYEAMVAEPERVSKELVSWCGLEWDAACLEFHKTRRPVRTASVTQVRQPIHRGSVGRWKNYQRWLSPMFARLARVT